MKSIHPTAIVHPAAKISGKVEIGPYCTIGEHVSIGTGTIISGRVTIEGNCSIGENNKIYTGAVIGSPPQDIKFKGEKTRLSIGNGNTIREFVTINVGTTGGGGITKIGDGTLLMAYCHIAHDCIVGSKVIIANAATLGGHVILEDEVIVSGLAGIHHFVRVGSMAILGGCSKLTVDIPPYCMADGYPATVRGLNVIALRRSNIPQERRNHLKKAYKILYRSGLNVHQALERIEKEIPNEHEIRHLVEFIKRTREGKSGRALQM